MLRRHFLRRLTVGAAGLLVADDALELLIAPERRIFPSAWPADPIRRTVIAREGWGWASVRMESAYIPLPELIVQHSYDGGIRWEPSLPHHRVVVRKVWVADEC